VDGKLGETALIKHLPKLRTAIHTVWNHDKALATSLENRLIAIMDEEQSRLVQQSDASSGDGIA